MKNWKWYERPIAAFWFVVGWCQAWWWSFLAYVPPSPAASMSRPEGQRVDERTRDERAE